MPTNDGHRQRVKNRFLSEGLDHFDEEHVLELLLFYCIPRKDTKPLAKTLIEQFGSLSQVLEAPPEVLQKVPEVGANVATFLSLITEVGRYYLVNRCDAGKILDTTEKYGKYLLPHFFGRRNETVFLLCMDAKCKMLCCRELGGGSVNSTSISVRQIVEVALGVSASMVVLAHNHPSGIAVPSGQDVLVTQRVAAALAAVEVALVDHIVVADEEFVSMVQSGLYTPGDV